MDLLVFVGWVCGKLRNLAAFEFVSKDLDVWDFGFLKRFLIGASEI